MNEPDTLLKPVSLAAARDKHLPVFYQVKHHPQVPDGHHGRIYVYEQQTDQKTMREFVNFAKTLTVPKGANEAVEKLGRSDLGRVVYVIKRQQRFSRIHGAASR
jgi:hypothetical protein